MKDRIEFDTILDEVLREVANPEPVEGLQLRVMRHIEVAQAAWTPVLTDVQMVPGNVPFSEAGLQEQGVFASLWNNLRAVVFPAKLPPLVLESRPVVVVDRMASGSNYPSTAYAVAFHALAIFLIGFVVNAQIRKTDTVLENVTVLNDPPLVPYIAPKTDQIGGGGGQKGPAPVTRGRLPKLVQEQLVAPKILPVQTSMIVVEPSVVAQKDLKMADNLMPDLGVPNLPLVARSSMGNGMGAGIGSGDGDGIGPGAGGNTGGGLNRVGGSVSAPKVIFQPEPLFSEEARKAKLSGNVLVYLWVDEHGSPTHVRVVRGLGMGLDEKAMEAVEQYKFRPAMKDGKPVTVEMYVDVVFTIL